MLAPASGLVAKSLLHHQQKGIRQRAVISAPSTGGTFHVPCPGLVRPRMHRYGRHEGDHRSHTVCT